MSYEYKVVELREGMIGGKMSGDQLEKVLNERAKQGWQLKALTSVEVQGTHRSARGRGSARDVRASSLRRRNRVTQVSMSGQALCISRVQDGSVCPATSPRLAAVSQYQGQHSSAGPGWSRG